MVNFRDSTPYQRFYRATEWFRSDLPSDASKKPTNTACACCVRPWASTESPEQSFLYQYGSGMALEQVCATCYTPRIGSKKALGVERLAAGNPSNPVYGKLGMLPGSAGIITPDDKLHLALPPGFISKYESGLYGQAGLIHHTANAFVLLAELFESGALTHKNLTEGIVFIEVWGRKADMLMSSLQATRSLSEVWCCSDKGAFMLDLQSIINVGKSLLALDLLNDATKPAFWKPIKDAAAGNSNEKKIKAWIAKVEKAGGNAQDIADQLPIDPHSRFRLNEVLRHLSPYIARGVF